MKIILFDEPTSALDPETIQEVLDVMIKLAKENITMVVVTHEMGFARQVADRVVFMADGQIIEEGTPDHFFENPSNERVKQFLGKIITAADVLSCRSIHEAAFYSVSVRKDSCLDILRK